MACLVGLALIGCTKTERADPRPGVEIRLEATDGGLPEQYVVLAVTQDGSVLRAHCPDGAGDPELACSEQGARAEVTSPLDEVTIKARGKVFQTVTVPEQARTIRVKLEDLPEAEVCGDYVTAFDANAELDDFATLAQRIDTDLGPTLSVKFYIQDPGGDPQVYFQNTLRYPLHYDFVRTVLGQPGTVRQFEQATYEGAQRSALAGTVIAYPALSVPSDQLGGTLTAPFTLTFFPSDEINPDQLLLAHRLIEERLQCASLVGGATRLVYLPAGTAQEQTAAEASDELRARDLLWTRHMDVYGGLSVQILNPGLAYGTLRRVSPEELAATVVSSRDLLLLPRLPNDLPVVAGTLTEQLQTPLSHVNVAARSRGTPNLALLGASQDERVQPFVGQLVRFEVGEGSFSLTGATLTEAEAFWESRVPERLVPDYDLSSQGLPGFDELGFEDAVRVGAKAANLAELARLLGDNAPHGFAVPFSAYDGFMTTASVTDSRCAEAHDECVGASRDAEACVAARSLCTAGAGGSLFGLTEQLEMDDGYASDSAVRDAALAAVRYLITHTPVSPEFGESLDRRVEEMFGTAQVRLRSSSNTEDLLGFPGSGLYESLSAEATGSERASLRIREVWASVWSYQAVEERRYAGVDDSAVRMGVAVNPAFDDELANGVLITQNIVDPTTAGLYLNVQLGEVSVANPENGAVAEALSLVPSPGGGAQAVHLRFSSLSPDASLLERGDLDQLLLLANSVQDHFAKLYEQNRFTFALDLEFKILPPDRRIVIKQARPYVDASGALATP